MSSTPRTPALLLALANRYPAEGDIIEITAALSPSAGEFLHALGNVREDLRYAGEELEVSWSSTRDYLIAEWAAELVTEVQHRESGGHHEPLPFGLSLYTGLVRRPDGTGIAVDTLFRGDPDMNEVIALLWGEAEDRATSYVDRKLREVAGAPPPSRSTDAAR